MKAIILTAGVGKRLAPLTDETPKSMIPVGGKPLLEYHLDYLKNLGITKIILVVGHLREKIEAFAGNAWKGTPIQYYESPDTRGGSLMSLWSARGEMNEEILIMDGDVFYPEALLKRLVLSPKANCLLADPSSADTGEEMVIYAEAGRAFFISKKPCSTYPPAGESVGFLKLSKPAAGELAKIVDAFVRAGKKGIEHEDTYPVLMQRCVVGYETVHDLKWTEIDSMEDLERAYVIASEAKQSPMKRLPRRPTASSQ
ncbi:MAG: phosphocholine cytidylyltransferase family protein [Candidatus Omnitrophica bacterium]|nr:phosphocholine cytidylyltransferase family protein [Candidatus Omnitrophota bacterium]